MCTSFKIFLSFTQPSMLSLAPQLAATSVVLGQLLEDCVQNFPAWNSCRDLF